MTPAVYITRVGKEGAARLSVDAEGLEVHPRGGSARHHPWSEIREIALRAPPAAGYLCQVTLASGERLDVSSAPISGPNLRSAQREGPYRAFVTPLLEHASSHPGIRFTSRSRHFFLALAIFAFLVTAMLIIVGLMLFSRVPHRPGAALPLVVNLPVVILLGQWLWANRHPRFDPLQPPVRLMPLPPARGDEKPIPTL